MAFAAARRLCQPQLLAALATAAEAAPPRQLVHLAAFSSSAASTQSGRVLGACVFERLPLVAPPDADWELEYFTWQAELTEKYYKKLPKELIDPKKLVEETTTEGGSRWEPAPLETEADRAGDRRSLRRRLDQRIFLLVRPAGKADAPYMLPHSQHKEGETIRQTAERVLGETVTVEEVQPYFVGNSPAGHVETEAGTMFFNRCQLIQGTPSLRPGSGYSDYAWVAKDELGEYIKHRPTLELLRKML